MPNLSDSMLDGHYQTLSGTAITEAACNAMHLCSGAETMTRATLISQSLADVAMASGDFTAANGDVSGRKVTVAAKTGVPVDVTGTAAWVGLINATNVLATNTLASSQALTSGNNVDIGAWRIEYRDPTAV